MNLSRCLFLLAARDSADRVVGENGRYEELIACSHEIAGSTAQLVAASKVHKGFQSFPKGSVITQNQVRNASWVSQYAPLGDSATVPFRCLHSSVFMLRDRVCFCR